jgi:hypothetical protein
MKKSENMPVCLSKMVLCPEIFHSLLRLVKGTAKINTCTEKNVIKTAPAA